MLEQTYGFCSLLARPAAGRGAPPQQVIERVGSLSPTGGFGSEQFPAERVGDAARDLVLYGEQIADIVVKTLRPEMRVGRCIDQLRVDPDLITRSSDAAFQCIAHPKFAADLVSVHAIAFV